MATPWTQKTKPSLSGSQKRAAAKAKKSNYAAPSGSQHGRSNVVIKAAPAPKPVYTQNDSAIEADTKRMLEESAKITAALQNKRGLLSGANTLGNPQEQNTYANAPTQFTEGRSGNSYYPSQAPDTLLKRLSGGGGGLTGMALNKAGEMLGTDNYLGGLLSAYNQMDSLGDFAQQSVYGMNDDARGEYSRQEATNPNWQMMSEAERVSLARKPQMDNQRPNAYINNPNTAQLAAMKPQGMPDNQWNALGDYAKMTTAREAGTFGGSGGGNGGGMMTQGIAGGATVPSGNTNSTFRPVTFRSAQDMLGRGEGLLGQAGSLAQQAPDEFNYNFDPTQAGQDLFNQRSALLEPQFAQQNTRAQESMFGTGRLGLRLAGEGLGAGEGSGMMSPDAFGVNTAQSQALAQLAAQSTNDAFGQELQRSGLDLSEYNANQMAQQQQYANLMGAGQGMFGAGGQLVGQQQQQQALDQNYEIGRYDSDTARITGQAQANRANYQPDPWLSGLTSLGTSFLGSNAGSGWLSGGLGKVRNI